MLFEALGVLAVALVVLIISAELVINSAIALARYLRISEMAIGFILLSVATALPELTVALVAAIDGHVDLAVGDAIGASVTDIGLVLGITAIVAGGIMVQKKELYDVVKVLFVSSILPLLLVLYRLSNFVVGVILLYVFFLYAYVILREGIGIDKAKESERITGRQAIVSVGMMLGGLVALVAAASYAVSSAVDLSRFLGVSQTFLGATILAAGTSMPELAVNLVALRKGHPGLVLGSTLGSSITNVSLLLGLVALVNPLTTNLSSFVNLVIFLIIMNLVLLYVMTTHRKITRWEGVILFVVWLLFVLSTLGVELGV